MNPPMPRPIHTLLVANRGEIALRVLATARRLGLRTVAVYSDADAHSPHVTAADTAFALGGLRSADSYLRVDRLLAAARATGADAIHPGYGFLSENADFAQAVIDAGLVWVGPPPAAIRSLGSKAGCKALARSQGVPCLPGYEGEDQRDEHLQAEAERIGYPVMVKAVAGGGGRGMRLVAQPQALPAALASARSEALAGFGCGDLLIERALLAPRHVEVQVFADAHGQVLHLGERDCSVQRRHQKIIEEAPSPAVDAALRERMGQCAVALARAAGYQGAGTVEFLLDGGDFYLMEMNTRLQVEHPVTEAITGLDLVEWQLRVAQGQPLPLRQDEVRLAGHAIEVRLCAEDAHFNPHTGQVGLFGPPPGASAFGPPRAALRFDHALVPGLEVTPYYDAMLGKLIAWAPTRDEAINRLVAALQATQVLGLPTNRAFLAACLDHPEFRAGQALIPFLNHRAAEVRESLQKREQEMTTAQGVVAVFSQNSALASVSALGCGYWRPARLRQGGPTQGPIPAPTQTLRWRELGHGRLQWRPPGEAEGPVQEATLQPPTVPGAPWVLVQDGQARAVWACALPPAPDGARRWHLQCEGVDQLLEDASHVPALTGRASQALELRAPFNGRVIAVPAQDGVNAEAGQTLVVIESMKLEHALAAPAPVAVAQVLVAVGQQVAPGQVLVRFAPQEAEPAPPATHPAGALA